MVRPKRDGPDWTKLKAEWLASRGETLNEFREKRRLHGNQFYRVVKEERWREDKQDIEKRALQRVADNMVDSRADEFERQIKLLTAIENHVAHLLRKHVSPEGKIISDIDPQELKALAEIVNKSVSTRKVIKGDAPVATEGGSLTINLHQTMVQVVNEIENDGAGATLLEPPDPKRRGQSPHQ